MENFEKMNQLSSDIYTIGISADGDAREGFLDAGVDVFFEKDITLTKKLVDTLKEQDAKKVLFIDDCQYLRKPIQMILSNKLGVDKEDIITAENPLEASKLVIDRDFIPDVVITDNEMPKMNGIPFVKFLRTGEEPDLNTKLIAFQCI